MRIMVLAPRFPYPLDKGDRLTVFNLLKYFKRRHEVALVTFLEPGQRLEDRQHFEHWVDAIYTVPLGRWSAYWRCVRGVFGRRPLQTCYYLTREMEDLMAEVVTGFAPDLVYAHSIRMGEYPLAHRSRPSVLAMQIAMTLNYQRLARFSRRPWAKLLYGFEHRKVRAYEPWIAARHDRCLLISQTDVAALGGRLGNVFISPHGVDFDYFKPSPTRTPEYGLIVFTGNMGYAANVDAICYFADEILPLIRARQPAARLAVVGTDPARAVRRLARDPAIEVTGRVPDLRPWLDRAMVGIDPLRIGAGLQNKVLEGMAMGLPMVITSIANEGIGARPDEHVLIADQPERFAHALVRLLEDLQQARALGARGRRFIVENWSWEHHFEALEEELVSLVAAHRNAAGLPAPAPGEMGERVAAGGTF